MRISRTACSALAIAGLVMLASPLPAAMAAPAPVRAIGLRPPAAAALLAKSIIKSDAFSGYAISAGPTSLKATFKVPRITCPSTADLGVSPGVLLAGFSPGGDTFALTQVYCSGGQANYVAVLAASGTSAAPFSVRPGDTITVSATDTTSASSATIRDKTTKATDTIKGAGDGATAAYAGTDGVETNGTIRDGIPRFTSVAFTSVSVGGRSLASVKPSEVERVNGKTVQLLPTAMTGGTAFKVVFKHL